MARFRRISITIGARAQCVQAAVAVMRRAVLLVVACGACALASAPAPDADWDQGSHDYIVANYYLKREFLPTSNLGAMLFKNELFYIRPRTKRFLVYLVLQKDSSWLAHSERVTTEHSQKLLEGCSVDNCDFVENPSWSRLSESGARQTETVVVELGAPPPMAPAHRHRQLWVLFAPGSPARYSKHQLDRLDGLFNWTMTYRPDADVPVPYGRTLPLLAPAAGDLTALIPHWELKQRTVLAAALLSNCRATARMNYLNTLRHHMRVHYYGGCFYRKPNEDCPKSGECFALQDYLFHLSFESAECSEYLSERVWEHALLAGAVPVLLGLSHAAAATLLPPGSYLHACDYVSPRALARQLQRIADNHHELMKYHAWRRHFAVVAESAWAGAAGSRVCRLCEALNVNEHARRLHRARDLRRMLDPALDCRNST